MLTELNFFYFSGMSQLSVTVLVENTAPQGFRAEHGLSLYIVYNGVAYLLDAGQSGAFLENAEKLGVNLCSVRAAVLSHAHYDHGDGFSHFFAVNKTAPLYLRCTCAENCFSGDGDARHFIGIKWGTLASYRARFVPVAKFTRIAEGVFLVPHTTLRLDSVGALAKLYREEQGECVPDDFNHEQSLVFRTNEGIAVFNSCSHAGAAVILDEVQKAFPSEKICAFVGGLHLSKMNDGEVAAYAERLASFAVPRIYTGHCTGLHASEILNLKLGGTVLNMTTGMTFVI